MSFAGQTPLSTPQNAPDETAQKLASEDPLPLEQLVVDLA